MYRQLKTMEAEAPVPWMGRGWAGLLKKRILYFHLLSTSPSVLELQYIRKRPWHTKALFWAYQKRPAGKGRWPDSQVCNNAHYF